MRRPALAVLALLAFALAGCSNAPSEVEAGPGPRVADEANMAAYVDASVELYRADPTYGYLYTGALSSSERNNFEVSGRAMCEAIIGGTPALDAYAAAYPNVAAAGNVGQLEQLHGQIAADTLCPTT